MLGNPASAAPDDSGPFVSSIDNALVSLSVAAQLVLFHVHSNRYLDPEESLAPELQRTARDIGALVPLYRTRSNSGSAPWGIAVGEPLNLDEWAIRRGDLRTALLRLGAQS
jgi:hypothetical protein